MSCLHETASDDRSDVLPADILLIGKPLEKSWSDATRVLIRSLAVNWPAGPLRLHVPVSDTNTELFKSGVDPVPVRGKSSGSKFHAKWRLFQAINNRGIHWDIVHWITTPVFWTRWVARRISMKNACRSVITVTHLPENRWMIRGLSVFDRIAALSATSRNRIQAETGRHVDLIYPSTGAFPSKEPAGPLTKLREDSGNIRIIYPGDLAFAEVESVLARGMYAILEKHEHVTFILASRIKTSRDERVERRIVRSLARFAGRVEVTRTAEDMRALLDGTDIVVFPVTSVYAKMDLPLVLIEAMGCGKPIIVSQCGSLPELVAYDNGLVFPSGDISGFIECLDCLITSESSCKAMGERGKKAAGEMFSVDRMMDSYMLVYRSLLAGECPS